MRDRPRAVSLRMIRKLFYLLAIGVVFALGILLGRRLESSHIYSTNRLGHVLQIIRDNYVDTLDMDSVHEAAIPLILANLDPHSTYLTSEMNRKESEGLNGSFQGIGVMFNRLTDTVVVVRVIEGGASERAGLRAGDRILRADSTLLYGDGLTDEDVMKALKGPDKSVVRLLVSRDGQEQEVAVVRGPVPVSTLDAAYVTDSVLYVRINRWGALTHREFLNAYVRNSPSKIRGVVVDLRDNVGGYLDAALALAGEFLPKERLLLYTEGRAFPREDYLNSSDGQLINMPLVVLVNEFSASASEIFAGVMQDYDRAQIVGRRTFGKGLVQQPFMLADGSAVRLTVARYYTPSGRSVQKSYAEGNESYAEDLERRYAHGELFNADSIAETDTMRYYTKLGRVVHGGGGVRPDIFVPRDSAGINSYYLRLVQSGTLPRFAFHYVDKRREELMAYKGMKALSEHLSSLGNSLLFDYAYYAQAQGIPIRTTLLYRSADLILRHLRAMIADNISPDRSAYYWMEMQGNAELTLALELIKTGAWRPILETESNVGQAEPASRI